MTTRRVFSGIQPTADSFHLGNYLGAVRQWVDLQDTRDAIYSVVDMHAITVPYEPETLRRRTKVAAAQLFAAGLDPDRCILFVQSQVPEHAELCWILGCLTGFGEANRMTQFKDKSAKGGAEAASVGLFTYPILQAADILLYNADEVPVGEDQRQHLELSRTLAQRFNHRFGKTFTVPEPYILPAVSKITDLQDPTSKMSKSSSSPQGIIDLLDEPAAIRRKINRAVTDAESEVRADDEAKPGVTNLLRIYAALSGDAIDDIASRYGDAGYGGFKKDLGNLVADTFAPIRERTAKLLADGDTLDGLLNDGARRAGAIATQTMAEVRDKCGFPAAILAFYLERPMVPGARRSRLVFNRTLLANHDDRGTIQYSRAGNDGEARVFPWRPDMTIEWNPSAGPTLGIEWEVQLVDAKTRLLRQDASIVLAGLPGLAESGEHPKMRHELMQSTIEVVTGICGTVAEAKADLAVSMKELQRVADPLGIVLASSGAHAISDWRDGKMAPSQRYAELVRELQWPSRQLQTMAVHVHVGLRDQYRVMPVINALATYLPHVLGLSASSPYWCGEDTGLASTRTVVFGSLPHAGPPLGLVDWESFERFMESQLRSGTIRTIKEVWWDVRPHPDFGTVEVRIADAVPTFREVGMLAALVQCLVHLFDTQLDRGYKLPSRAPWVIEDNKWRATRHGLDATIVTSDAGTTAPLRDEVYELVRDLEPVACRLGCAEELAVAAEVLEWGAPYERQRAVHGRDDDLTSVVDALVTEFAEDKFVLRGDGGHG